MKSIVRKDSGQDWQDYLQGLARAEGLENPTAEDLRRLDRGRPDKKVSNQDWQSPTDPDSRIARMKDGRTHLAYKAEHAVDLESEAIVAATVATADQADPASAPTTLTVAQANLVLAGSRQEIKEVVMDKGYHDNRLLADLREQGIRTYIPERRQKHRCWTNKPTEYEPAFRGNRRRVRGARGRRLNRWRSERCERTFAHVCETGGGRRAWLRGLVNVSKAHVLRCAAYNLGLLLRKVWGYCKPRNAQAGTSAGILGSLVVLWLSWLALTPVGADGTTEIKILMSALLLAAVFVAGRFLHQMITQNRHSLTGC
jgi:transposase